MAARLAQHPWREVERDHERAPVAALELAREATGAGTQVEYHGGQKIERREALEELRGHPRLQPRGRVIARARAIERGAQLRAIESERLAPLSHAGTP